MKIFDALGIALLAATLGLGTAYAADAPPAPASNASPPSNRPPASAPDARPAAAPGDLEPAVSTSAAATSPAASSAAQAEKPAAVQPAPKPAAAAANAAQSATPRAQSANAAPRGKVMDRLNLDETQVTGNSELPKVLYIVPWKRPDLGDLNGKPMNSLLDEVLTPIDRDVFRRENRYYDALAAAQPDGTQGNPAARGTKGARDEK